MTNEMYEDIKAYIKSINKNKATPNCERIEGDMTIKQIKLYDGDKEEIWFDAVKESDTDGCDDSN